jgi:hypothetical protein
VVLLFARPGHAPVGGEASLVDSVGTMKLVCICRSGSSHPVGLQPLLLKLLLLEVTTDSRFVKSRDQFSVHLVRSVTST